MTDRARSWLAGLTVLALLTGCTSGDKADLRPGQLLTAHPLTTAAALPGADTRLITYVSEDSHGQPIVVSGTVSVPRGTPPDGGWPVISWAHGTTGYADTCAPSADTTDGLVHDYISVVNPVLDGWIGRGYAVVQTDYQGLGTPGGHPYIDGVSEAHTVTDIVAAARELDSSINGDYVAMGHSQGGQAVLFTAADPDRGGLNLLGAVALAPGGVDLRLAVDLIRSGNPEVTAAQRFVPLLVLGAAVVEPTIDPDSIFTAKARPLLTAARTACVAQINEVPTVPSGQVFAADADLGALGDFLDRQDPTRVDPQVPVLIAQGTNDVLVSRTGTDKLAKAFCDKEVAVDYQVYQGEDHRGVIAASVDDVQAFLDAAPNGDTVNTCPSR
ncbi:alpha/beta hydrolase family protein [Mycolicibacterium vaccae]|uniref:alpha/beta hydrolase family protein n=1 Tax=Mycolicibacterium vaccae TaxID=1810 RepID=UPI003D00ECC1